MPDDVAAVFAAWRATRPRPKLCKLTTARRKQISKALQDYTAADLLALIRYANQAQTAEARFWRGENDRGQEYLDLMNLLRISKLDGRIERAILWAEGQASEAAAEAAGVDLGPMGLLRGMGEA